MRFREMSAWFIAGSLTVGYAWYAATVVGQAEGVPVADIEYQGTAVAAAVVVTVLIATAHIVMAGMGHTEPKREGYSSKTIGGYGGHIRGVVLAAGAVLGTALAMFEADYFWIANVALAGLVLSEIAAAGAQIVSHRRGV